MIVNLPQPLHDLLAHGWEAPGHIEQGVPLGLGQRRLVVPLALVHQVQPAVLLQPALGVQIGERQAELTGDAPGHEGMRDLEARQKRPSGATQPPQGSSAGGSTSLMRGSSRS